MRYVYRTGNMLGYPFPAMLLVAALILTVAGCGGGDRDAVPTFEDAGIPDKRYVQNLPIDMETLPAASGGDGALTYAISPPLPAGLVFDPGTRQLSGTPTEPQTATRYTYTATDIDSTSPDSASLTFTVTVQPDLAPAFQQVSIPDKSYVHNLPIDTETLPLASGGDGALTYAISPPLPAGLVFDPVTRQISGTPTEPQTATRYTYTATDSDPVAPDSASLTFAITVETLAAVTLSAQVEAVNEGDDLTPVGVTVTLSHAVTGDVAVTLASTGSARLGSDVDLAAVEVDVIEGSTQATTLMTPIRDLEAEDDELVSLHVAAVAGRGDIGAPSSVAIAIRDLGAPSQADYAELDALMWLSGGKTYDIDTDALYLTYIVRNRGRLAHRGRPVYGNGLLLRNPPVPAPHRLAAGTCPGAGWTVF